MRFAWLVAGLCVVLASGAGGAADVLINNGFDCSHPDNNVSAEMYADDTIYLRNGACPPGVDPAMACAVELWTSPTELCVGQGGSLPGARVEVRDDALLGIAGGSIGGSVTARELSNVFLDSGSIEGSLYALDGSSVLMLGGSVQGILEARDDGLIDMRGGSAPYLWTFEQGQAHVVDAVIGEIVAAYGTSGVHVGGGALIEDVLAFDGAEVTLEGGGAVGELWSLNTSRIYVTGGQVVGAVWAFNSSRIDLLGGYLHGGDLVASGTARIRVSGMDFEVDGEPVDYGDLAATSGVLRGTLASGELLDSVFYQGGGGCPYDGACSGTITLTPPVAIEVPALPGWGLFALAAALCSSAAVRLRRGGVA